jgi:hypothetical protein
MKKKYLLILLIPLLVVSCGKKDYLKNFSFSSIVNYINETDLLKMIYHDNDQIYGFDKNENQIVIYDEDDINTYQIIDHQYYLNDVDNSEYVNDFIDFIVEKYAYAYKNLTNLSYVSQDDYNYTFQVDLIALNKKTSGYTYVINKKYGYVVSKTNYGTSSIVMNTSTFYLES